MFGQIRQLCRSDENASEIDALVQKYEMDQGSASEGGPGMPECDVQFAREASTVGKPAAVAGWQPVKFYKKQDAREVFVWSSPDPEHGKIVGVVGQSAQLVVQGHHTNAEASTAEGDWIRVANPFDKDSKVAVFGSGEAWCLYRVTAAQRRRLFF